MSIEALILGKLHQAPERRTAKNGREFVTAKVRAAVADADAIFVNVIAFDAKACAALLALEPGDSLALAGTLKLGAWTDKDGNARPNADMLAAQVLTVYALKQRRDAARAADESAPER